MKISNFDINHIFYFFLFVKIVSINLYYVANKNKYKKQNIGGGLFYYKTINLNKINYFNYLNTLIYEYVSFFS